jgi:hypothetical protein
MCPICLCEHNEEKHGKGFVHITALIEEGMKDIHKCIDQTPADKKKMEELNAKVEEILNAKKEISNKFDNKLEEIKGLCENHVKLAKEKNEGISKSTEAVKKLFEIWESKLVSRVAIPKELEPALENLKAEKKYWEAYNKVTKTLANEVILDDNEVKKELANCETLGTEFQKDLEFLSSTIVDPTELKKILDSKGKVEGIILLLINRRASKAKRRISGFT